MRIDRSKPHPPHLQKRFEEMSGKLILERLFPDRYSDLKLSDKPDLQDSRNSIGVEVTSSMGEEDREGVRLWNEAVHLPDGVEKEKKIKRLQKLGVKYSGGIQCWPAKHYSPFDANSGPCYEFLTAVRKKLDKLNQGHYAQMQQYDLFVSSDLFMWPEEQEARMAWLLSYLEKENKREHNFSFIYALGCNALYIWNLREEKYMVRGLDIYFQKVFFEAKELVIQEEESKDE